MRPSLFSLLLLPALLLLACGDAPPPAPPTLVFQGSTMGTTYTVKAVDVPEARRDEFQAAISAALEDVDSRMSTWREDSELSRFNRHDTTPFPLSAETAAVFRQALEIGERSGGAFDITIKPLVDAWGFGPGVDTPEPPTEAEMEALRERSGRDKLELDADGTLRKARPDVVADLSAIAKGDGVDRVAEALEGLGVERYMVEVGGEVRTAGTNPDGQIWRIGVERPDGAIGQIQRIVPVDGMAMATSGDYRNYREVDGRRVSHIMDPRSGHPVDHRLASVSVLAPRCAFADAWATTLLVLGPGDGLAVAEREGLATLFLVRSDDGFREMRSSAFDTLLESVARAEETDKIAP